MPTGYGDAKPVIPLGARCGRVGSGETSAHFPGRGCINVITGQPRCQKVVEHCDGAGQSSLQFREPVPEMTLGDRKSGLSLGGGLLLVSEVVVVNPKHLVKVRAEPAHFAQPCD